MWKKVRTKSNRTQAWASHRNGSHDVVARGEIVMNMDVVKMVVKKVFSKDNSHDGC